MADGLLAFDTALVTGTASGIGRGIARALGAEGARVRGADIDAERGAAIAAEIGADFVQSDLSRPDEPARRFAAALKMLGEVSIFVHCAAPRRREEQTALAVTAG